MSGIPLTYTERRSAVRQLLGASADDLDRRIRAGIAQHHPLPLSILIEAHVAESLSVGARATVLRTLRREIKRQEALLPEDQRT